ncbi:cellulose synthase/poly-beta-1,6-N-acetylglucosamine synthase-like glycosyltransferase [Povalibacter uvarum]|uniref:Cellulose synthase/poly-beta-1,6-N-acetylglucosamine synthase-like glycosyltransferase n=1 Tax=Povalibacter uvarum TaxID=732238 RepID=A0A841HHD6_9GAMM|nr:glycosyltransferase family 2 protein [Povalibacter uvarum]MBB6091632.1 cellulose synthase/poly-beta-1,6-N-acetylglucosamine synthase-like glycosyltransferase [Povalibacter uvarum]
MLEWIFWILLLLGVYPYVLYPIFVKLIGKVVHRRIAASDTYLPRVTVLTAAFNEAAHIEATVRNKLQQDYPAELLDVIVISDESVDGTDDIVARIAAENSRVRLLRQVPRQGKTSGLNLAMPEARGEIVIFADANSIYRPDTIRRLVRNFADPKVGYVTGKMVYVNPDGSLVGDGCSAFMRYENALRAAETQVGSVVGVDGGVDAVRPRLYKPMRADQLPDFVLPLTVVEQGYRVVFEPEANLTEDTLTTEGSEYRMRVRVALRALWALWDKRGLLNPFRYGLFAWQLWSHKVLRYMSFLPLVVAMVLNWWLLDSGPIYIAALVGQLVFLVFVATALIGPRAIGQSALGRYCFYFALLNWASAVAFTRFLRGQKQVLWQPRVG